MTDALLDLHDFAVPAVPGIGCSACGQAAPPVNAGARHPRGRRAPPGGGKRRTRPPRDRAAPDGPLDPVSQKALAGVTTTTAECAEGVGADGAPCSSRRVTGAMAAFAEAAGVAPENGSPGRPADSAPPGGGAGQSGDLLPTAATPEAAAVRDAAAALGCASESCVVTHPTFRQFVVEKKILPNNALAAELNTRFKAPGPRDSLALLSNYNIDETLQRWARVFPEFFPCPFAMMDFDATREEFATVDLAGVLRGTEPAYLGPGFGAVRRPATCFGCVVNTDNSYNPGKHWVAVFVDCRPPPGEPWTVEYFNSVGRPPPKPMVKWQEKKRALLAKYRAELGECRNAADGMCDVVTVPVTDIDHQESQTECGLYALFYIRRRLEGTPFTFFTDQLVPDAAMTAFRKHVFRAA